jgi:hypothetical protein
MDAQRLIYRTQGATNKLLNASKMLRSGLLLSGTFSRSRFVTAGNSFCSRQASNRSRLGF